VVTDLETTGFTPGLHQIIEVAAVRLRGFDLEAEFSTLVDPGGEIPWRITEITGISTAMVRGAARIHQVLPRYLEFLGEGCFVAHNVPFDRRFLDYESARLGYPLANPSICTLALARRFLGELRSRSLDAVAQHLGIRNAARHRALGDACATAEVLRCFLRRAQAAGVRRRSDLFEYWKD
jgi:DNA polymerase III subunit epsilon